MAESSIDTGAIASKRVQPALHGLVIGEKFVAVDLCDMPRVTPYEWKITESRPGYFYARGNVDGVLVYMHRLLVGAKPGQVVDHKDGDGLNNRRSNLRPCTHGENSRNKKVAPGRRWKGIALYRDKKIWVARIAKNGITYYLGSFATPRKAAAVYNRVARRLHGEFALLNRLDRP